MSGLGTLPSADPTDLKHIRRFLPVKILGRLAAFLAVLIILFSTAGAVDLLLVQVLQIDLRDRLALRVTIFFLLPASVVVAQIVLEARAASVARRQRLLAVASANVPTGYFRIGRRP